MTEQEKLDLWIGGGCFAIVLILSIGFAMLIPPKDTSAADARRCERAFVSAAVPTLSACARASANVCTLNAGEYSRYRLAWLQAKSQCAK